MAILKCDKCGFEKQVADSYVGAKVRCPGCDQISVVEADEHDLGLEEVIDQMPQLPSSKPKTTISAEMLQKAKQNEQGPALLDGGLLRNLLGGTASGLTTILLCLAAASLVFVNGASADYFPFALSMALVSAVIMNITVCLRSRIPAPVAGPETMAVLILVMLVQSIHQSMAGQAEAAINFTSFAAILISALFTGVCLLGAATSRSANYLRYLPIQAIGGILAGVGFYIIVYAIQWSSGTGACLEAFIQNFTELSYCIKWMPTVAMGIILFPLIHFARNAYIVVTACALGASGIFGFLQWQGITLDAARETGWLFTATLPKHIWETLPTQEFAANINWYVLVDHAAYITALAALIGASAMVRITEMETRTRTSLNLDREFSAIGVGNILTAFAGGMPGTISMDRTMAKQGTGACGRLSGLMTAGICALGLAGMEYALPYIPRMLPAGLLVALGLSLMYRWLFQARKQLTRRGDYALLFLTFLLTATLGLLVGLALGAGMAMLVTAARYGSVSVVKHEVSGASFHSKVDRAPSQLSVLKEHGDQIHVLTLQGFIFLGTTDALIRQLDERTADEDLPPLKYVLLDFTFISGLDSSVAVSFIKLKNLAVSRGFTLVFTNVPFELEEQFAKAGCKLDDEAGGSITSLSLDYALEWAENNILENYGALSVAQKDLPELLKPVFPEPRYIPALMKVLKRITVKRGQTVFRQGDPSDAMYFIEKGMVNVELEIEGGKKLRLKKMGPGTVFGEMGLYTTAPRSASIIATEDCVLYRLPTKVVNLLQTKRPELASCIHRFIVSLLADRVFGANETIRDILR